MKLLDSQGSEFEDLSFQVSGFEALRFRGE
jgi:hypothetical protein